MWKASADSQGSECCFDVLLQFPGADSTFQTTARRTIAGEHDAIAATAASCRMSASTVVTIMSCPLQNGSDCAFSLLVQKLERLMMSVSRA